MCEENEPGIGNLDSIFLPLSPLEWYQRHFVFGLSESVCVCVSVVVCEKFGNTVCYKPLVGVSAKLRCSGYKENELMRLCGQR